MGEVEEKEGEKKHKVEEEQGGERQEKDEEEEEEVEEDDSMESDVRNTDSVFSELSELSHDYVESVDRGASVRGKLIKKSCLKSFFMYFPFILNWGFINRYKALTAQELASYHFVTLNHIDAFIWPQKQTNIWITNCYMQQWNTKTLKLT